MKHNIIGFTDSNHEFQGLDGDLRVENVNFHRSVTHLFPRRCIEECSLMHCDRHGNCRVQAVELATVIDYHLVPGFSGSQLSTQ
jgi:hypothetical protein